MKSEPKRAVAENHPETEPRRLPGFILHLFLFASGGLALVYEILWMRRFTAVFGATTPAVAATLAAVFLGFTVGSLWIGARAVRWRRPLRAYGLLEVGAGVGALLVEPLLNLYDWFYPDLYRMLAGSPAGFVIVKTALALAALFVPTACMGGTVPLLGHAITAERRHLGIGAGGLYAANTLGAALGAFSVPFFWLPNFSARASYGTCIAASLVLGVAAWCLDRGERSVLPTTPLERPPQRVHSTALSFHALAGFAALSGALFFVLQVIWSRMFAQVHENSIYSFSVVVAVLLVGLAGGAALARRFVRRDWTPERVLGAAWIGGGIMIFATPQVFHSLTDGLSYVKGAGGWASYGLRILWLTMPTILAPSVMAGMVLPLLMELGGRASDKPTGRVLGWLVGMNTAGAILGSLAGAFVLPTLLGLWASLVFVAVSMVVAGDYFLGVSASARLLAPRRVALYSLMLCGLFLWNPAGLPRTKFRSDQAETLRALAEGSHGIVAVVEKGGSRRLKLNNFYILGGTASTGDERLQGHLPLLLHPAPKHVAFLGVGTGITAGAALLHPVERITAVEIVPEVIDAARDHFAHANLELATASRVEIVTEDARNYLRGSRARFDVIVGDLVVPWRRGEAALYTVEHFETARRSLKPGGLFCQWLPLFQLSEEEFDIVTATFLDVFGRATLWRGDFAPNEPAVALVGHSDGRKIDPATVERRIRELKTDEANPMLVHPAGFWMFFVGTLDPAEERFVRARRNQDNRPWLEILGPLTHAGSTRGEVPLFVGRRLEAFLDQVRVRPLAGSALARADFELVRWREAGARLGMASILSFEGKSRAAEALTREAALVLPSEIRSAFERTGAP